MEVDLCYIETLIDFNSSNSSRQESTSLKREEDISSPQPFISFQE